MNSKDNEESKTLSLHEMLHSNVGDLKAFLATLDDNERLELEFKVKRRKDDENAVQKLEVIIHGLLDLISAAEPIVEHTVEEEKKTGSCTIYYDRRRGSNGGATDLLADMKEALEATPKAMIQVALEEGF